MKYLLMTAVVAGTLALVGCSPYSEEEYKEAVQESQESSLTEKMVSLSDGTQVLCLVSMVNGGYVYECDWTARQWSLNSDH